MPEAVRCRISGPFPYIWLGMVVLFTVVGAPTLLIATIRGGTNSPPPAFAAVWIGIVLWFWYVALVWVAYEIRLSASGEIEFKSVLRSIKVDGRELTYIGPAMGGLDPYTVIFKTPKKRARALRQMHGFHRLLSELIVLNPAIELRGV